MAYVIYESMQVALQREEELTQDGIKAGYFPEGERYDNGGLMTENIIDGRVAIEIFKSPGLITGLCKPDIMPCNYEPLFTAEELNSAVDALPEDWPLIQYFY